MSDFQRRALEDAELQLQRINAGIERIDAHSDRIKAAHSRMRQQQDHPAEAATTDLASWLLERIAEDEAEIAAGFDFAVLDSSGWMGHAASWDRDRALAECEAKRRIVELHRPAEGEFYHGSSTGSVAADLDNVDDGSRACATCGEFTEYGVPWPCSTLRLLAVPYADRDGYREEWRP